MTLLLTHACLPASLLQEYVNNALEVSERECDVSLETVKTVARKLPKPKKSWCTLVEHFICYMSNICIDYIVFKLSIHEKERNKHN